MTAEEYEGFRHNSVHALMGLNDACEREFSISAWPRWDYHLDQGILVFSEGGAAKVVADIQVVGTTSKELKTWMWGWANDNLPHGVTAQTDAIREFGKVESLTRFTTDVLTDDDYLGWEMTAVTAKLLQAKGAFRCPLDDGFLYVVYTEIQFAKEGELPTGQSDADSIVNCVTHGASQATYICEHLFEDPAQEWFSEEPSDKKPWPDSWCAQCDLVFLEQGSWNDSNSSSVRIRLICHHCYQVARSKGTFV